MGKSHIKYTENTKETTESKNFQNNKKKSHEKISKPEKNKSQNVEISEFPDKILKEITAPICIRIVDGKVWAKSEEFS